MKTLGIGRISINLHSRIENYQVAKTAGFKCFLSLTLECDERFAEHQCLLVLYISALYQIYLLI